MKFKSVALLAITLSSLPSAAFAATTTVTFDSLSYGIYNGGPDQEGGIRYQEESGVTFVQNHAPITVIR